MGRGHVAVDYIRGREIGTNQNEGTSSGDGRRQAKKRILGGSVPHLALIPAERERDDRPNLASNFKERERKKKRKGPCANLQV